MGKFSIMCMQIDELNAAGYSYEEIAEMVGWNPIDVGSYLVSRENENYISYMEEDHGFSGDVEDFSI